MSDLPADYAFANPPPDRADHLRDDAHALRALWPEAGVLLLDVEGHALARDGGERHAPVRGIDLAPQLPDEAVFLALHEGRGWFALPLDAAHEGADGAPRIDLRAAAMRLPAFDAGLHAHARALLHWRATHRFCGRCGGPLQPIRAGHAARCTGCGSEHYPRTDTAIIVSISDGQRLLLGRQASWPAKRYSVIAGFLEPGERLEDAVVREVFEETGLRVRACRYAGSQPWPFPANLMVGFEAEADADEPRFGGELEDARWFSAEQIHAAVAAGELLLSPRLSISSWLIRRWLARQGRPVATR
ncbi:MAG TPA: NAD(+) diphosphatase [Xanthomonadaceae bacterium]